MTATGRARYWTDESWYPPPAPDSKDAPGPGWWMGEDGEWHPPEEAQTALGRYYRSLAVKPRPRWLPPRRWIIVGVVVAVALVAFVGLKVVGGGGTPPSPSAAYLAETRAGAGGTVLKNASDADVLALGQGVCAKLATETTAKVEAGMLAAGRGQAFPAGDAELVIRAATAHLCAMKGG